MADFAIVRVCYEIFMTFVEQGFVLRVRKVEKGVVMFLFLGKRARDNSKETGRTTSIRKTEYAGTNSTFTGTDR